MSFYLAATGYRGGGRCADTDAVTDGNLVTAGPTEPVAFAREVLRLLGVYEGRSWTPGTACSTTPTRPRTPYWRKPQGPPRRPPDEPGTAEPPQPRRPRRLPAQRPVPLRGGRTGPPAGLTAAWWQVLGAVLPEPLPVAGIARVMGITRQSVQRVADLLVGEGLAEYLPNPAHRRAKLLSPTAAGRTAVAAIGPGHATLADRLARALGEDGFAETVRILERLSAVLDEIDGAATDVTETPGAVTEP